jgi:hypothetical protein
MIRSFWKFRSCSDTLDPILPLPLEPVTTSHSDDHQIHSPLSHPIKVKFHRYTFTNEVKLTPDNQLGIPWHRSMGSLTGLARVLSTCESQQERLKPVRILQIWVSVGVRMEELRRVRELRRRWNGKAERSESDEELSDYIEWFTYSSKHWVDEGRMDEWGLGTELICLMITLDG